MPILKKTLAQLDDDLLTELFEVAQFALNDARAVKRIAAELHMPVARVQALALIAVQLSSQPDAMPEVSTVAQLDVLQAELGAYR
ncbi:hypothetical protein [Pseudomonas syringae pv. coryli]|uniref:hypothetical protein n=1 Tax=Pseudomonas syringae pv. coryli TaxID=317659 RepID=UPI003D2CCCDF